MNLSTVQQNAICQAVQCRKIVNIKPMQSLWAGQGNLARLVLEREDHFKSKVKTHTLVVKQINFLAKGNNPYGWNTDLAQQRKHHSYLVELAWYKTLGRLNEPSNLFMPTPKLIYSEESEQGVLMALEDLNKDYPIRFTAGKEDRPSDVQIQSSIRWLAQLHARFLNMDHKGIWPVGGYWHLATRPDELAAMPDGALKQLAAGLDEMLESCPYQTVIHGDAKLANFCFNDNGTRTAAVDFQYVGKGPGVKDLMLLMSSVLPDSRLMQEGDNFVDFYFSQLGLALEQCHPEIDADDVIKCWRPLYVIAWADFHRFLSGWRPGHWKIGKYCQQQTHVALKCCISNAN